MNQPEPYPQQANENPQRKGIVRERLPGIAGGTASGMAVPVIAVGAVAAAGAALAGGGGGGGDCCCYVGGGGGGCGTGPDLKPTTWGAFLGSFAGSVGLGVKFAHDAYKAAGDVLTKSAIGPTLKGWGIGGVAGSAGAVALVATAEAAHHAYKNHQQRGEEQRAQNDAELGLRQPRGTYQQGVLHQTIPQPSQAYVR